MTFKGDISGIDDLLEKIDDKYFSGLSEIGREATRNAKANGNYRNHTWNLRNASGGCVVRDGKIIDLWIETDGSHPVAVENTRNLLIYSEKQGDGLYLANGMQYASSVESKGYDVIMTNGLLYAERQIKKKI